MKDRIQHAEEIAAIVLSIHIFNVENRHLRFRNLFLQKARSELPCLFHFLMAACRLFERLTFRSHITHKDRFHIRIELDKRIIAFFTKTFDILVLAFGIDVAFVRIREQDNLIFLRRAFVCFVPFCFPFR